MLSCLIGVQWCAMCLLVCDLVCPRVPGKYLVYAGRLLLLLVFSVSMITLLPTIVCVCGFLIPVLRFGVRCLCGVGGGGRFGSSCLGICA